MIEEDPDGPASVSSFQGNAGSAAIAGFAEAAIAPVEIFNDGRYSAFVQDLECVWRWEIHRDGQFVQEGCSLSERSSREAVGYVMSFYRRRDERQAAEPAICE
ncbi:soluble methane monooxygenase-binding protein MmoD [Methyloferula stellata]|uniref:soluble methane monooxygenase-binding protein MmoD n=1 Tax=Methyloferula stellata TaxID=876270 RepID=UPI00037F179B|nr:soluble methane monooxygenase-binding protein MmoD [Methyloferula stellata]